MEAIPPYVIRLFWLIFVFCFGACVGSLLNVVVARLPLEKSLIWPGSRCGSCLQPIRNWANIPILSYLILRGKCYSCKSKYSSRYFWVELATACAFTALFYADIMLNIHGLAYVQQSEMELSFGWVPWRCWVIFGWHATLLSFLIAASLCDFDGKIIPLPLTMSGTVIGLCGATLFAWPWPNEGLAQPQWPKNAAWYLPENATKLTRGLYNWPLWGPLPDWLRNGSWQLGLLTGLAGAAVGNILMRSIKYIFEKGLGREALGLGDADLMMMAGAFLGWQMVIVAFVIGTFAALFVAVPQVLFRRDRALPFGPGLSIGIIICMLAWRWLSPALTVYFFDWLMLVIVSILFGGGMFVASMILGLIRPKTE